MTADESRFSDMELASEPRLNRVRLDIENRATRAKVEPQWDRIGADRYYVVIDDGKPHEIFAGYS